MLARRGEGRGRVGTRRHWHSASAQCQVDVSTSEVRSTLGSRKSESPPTAIWGSDERLAFGFDGSVADDEDDAFRGSFAGRQRRQKSAAILLSPADRVWLLISYTVAVILLSWLRGGLVALLVARCARRGGGVRVR